MRQEAKAFQLLLSNCPRPDDIFKRPDFMPFQSISESIGVF